MTLTINLKIRDADLEPQPPAHAPDAVLCRMRDDNTSPRWGGPRQIENLPCPPMVDFLYIDCTRIHGGSKVDISQNGWDDFLRWLNGDKYEAAIGDHLAMFNSGWPKMHYSLFGCNLGWFKQAVVDGTIMVGWAEHVSVIPYEDGIIPSQYQNYKDNPVLVQKFTMICSGGAILSRNPELYYPNVGQRRGFVPWVDLEVYSQNMQTPAPPVVGKV